jgi:hypothetical protein
MGASRKRSAVDIVAVERRRNEYNWSYKSGDGGDYCAATTPFRCWRVAREGGPLETDELATSVIALIQAYLIQCGRATALDAEQPPEGGQLLRLLRSNAGSNSDGWIRLRADG